MSRRWRFSTAVVLAAAAGAAAAVGGQRAGSAEASAVVHGRWTVDVRDHGRLVSRHRFHNALGPDAGESFSSFLGKTKSGGRWAVYAQGAMGLCLNGTTCRAVEPPYTSTPATAKLTVAANGSTVVLNAEWLAPNAGTITGVNTVFFTGTSGSPNFTQKSGLNIKVVQGQEVLITVNLTFQ